MIRQKAHSKIFNVRLLLPRVMISCLGIFSSATVVAEEAPIKLEEASLHTHNSASIERGAKIYATYCLTCHTLNFMEHDPFAKQAGITPNKMPDKNKNWWFGSVPPDMTLMARIHGADWLYTYLHVFYKDPGRPTGSNNLLLPNVNMPNPFVGLQGEQHLVVNKRYLYQDTNLFTIKAHYYTALELAQRGTLSPDQFDKMINDLVNFLVYASEPKKVVRERLGIGVLIFLAIFIIIAYLLKQAYWKKIKD